MRVIAGTKKGYKLAAVPSKGTRPILDRVKTALFDILDAELLGANVLDLFAGSGSIGIEALSRGAISCTFIDNSFHAVQTIKMNLQKTGFEQSSLLYKRDAFGYLRHSTESFDIIFVAPPQYKDIWRKAVELIDNKEDNAKPADLIVVQIDPREYKELPLRKFQEEKQRKYGNTLLVFYRYCK